MGARAEALRRLLEQQGVDGAAQDFDDALEAARLPSSEPKVSLSVGEPVVTERIPFPSAPPMVAASDQPEHADVVTKAAGARAAASPRAKESGASVVSPEERMRLALKVAEAEALGERGWARLRAAGRGIGRAISRQDQDDSYLRDELAEADRPIKALKEAQALERKGLADKAELDAKVKEFVEKMQAQKDERAERVRREDSEAAFKRDQLAETSRHNRQVEETNAFDAKSRAAKYKNTGGYGKGGKGVDAGKQMPASEGAQIGELDAAVATLDDLFADWESNANEEFWPDAIAAKLPGTAASRYTDKQKAAAQTVGTILEGGKLGEADLPRYLNLLPSAGDGKERAEAKVKTLKKMLGDKRAAKLNGLGRAGFDVRGFQDQPLPAPSATPASSDEMVMMQAPNGQRRQVPRAKVQAAIAAGGKVL